MTDTAVPAVRPLEDVGEAAPRPSRPRGRRRVVLVGSAVAVFVAALLGLGTDALVTFGLLLAFSTDIDEEESGRAVVATPRNVALAAVMVAGFAWFWVERLALTELGLCWWVRRSSPCRSPCRTPWPIRSGGAPCGSPDGAWF